MHQHNSNGKIFGFRGKRSRAERFAAFDSLPREIKEFYWNRPLNNWPPQRVPSPDDLERYRIKDLASIAPTWGPEHPEALRASSQVTIRNGKPVALLTADDLTDWL